MSRNKPLLISKTIFLEFLQCSKNSWLKLHRPDLHSHYQLSEFEKHLLKQGNEVDFIARNLFPGGIEIVGNSEEACQETTRHMTLKAPSLFQSTFIVDKFIARNDILAYDESNDCWNLYEVKGANSLKEGSDCDHINDVAFQASVLKRANIRMGKYYIIYLSKDYIRQGDLDIDQLLVIEDTTEKVLARLHEVEVEMEAAKKYLSQENEPAGACQCIFLGRSKHCTTFSYSNPDVPKYSVHDIARIGSSKKKLKSLIDRQIFDISQVSENIELSDIQWNQVRSHKAQKPIIDVVTIQKKLDALVFPLYFLDYETFAPAIPIFDGFKPYQRIPFQLSLHILDTPEGQVRHIEYLHEERSDPSECIVDTLQKHINRGGRILAWNQSFEAGVHREIGQRHQKYQVFLESLNVRLYDLMEIFQKQHYVHPKFYGSNSIKYILPALIPNLQYGKLVIQDGGQASDAWWKMVSLSTTPEESKSIAKDLKDYCGFDTYAMYALWKKLFALK